MRGVGNVVGRAIAKGVSRSVKNVKKIKVKSPTQKHQEYIMKNRMLMKKQAAIDKAHKKKLLDRLAIRKAKNFRKRMQRAQKTTGKRGNKPLQGATGASARGAAAASMVSSATGIAGGIYKKVTKKEPPVKKEPWWNQGNVGVGLYDKRTKKVDTKRRRKRRKGRRRSGNDGG